MERMHNKGAVVVSHQSHLRGSLDIDISRTGDNGAEAVEGIGRQGIQMAEIVGNHPHIDVAL